MTEAPVGSLAVICAIESELTHLRSALGQAREIEHSGRFYWITKLEHDAVILSRCGVGMLSAAAATEGLIARFRPRAILNYGCSGAHREYLLPGDIVVGTRFVAYDNLRVAPDGTERYAGMRHLRRGEQVRADYLPAAPHLLDAALRAANAVKDRHEPWPRDIAWPAGVAHRAPILVTGTLASADRWNRSRSYIQQIAEHHESLCEDMESAAIALTCATHDVPFLSIRDISNNELLRATNESFGAETEGQLGRRAAVLILETLRELAIKEGV